MSKKRKSVIGKLNSLCLGEFLAAVSFTFCFYTWVWTLNISIGWIDIISFYILIYILLQGSFFWLYLKRKTLRRVNNKERYQLFFIILRNSNIVLFVLDLIVIIVFGEHKVFNLFILTFSLIEYVNYYFIRLSYPPKEFLARVKTLNFKSSKLNKEIKSR
ncbi:hypothetical protein [Caldisalinibacter kiritimatiensis]|uniref:Uncharacterized protein n=1 Tax=Caldisalinibacter kiritimatiensis TaxID=1304284 RepID=R1AU88_9FIRM|nr:hypothetical protein [Caldisalinibacter kiritimatiensis]EOD00232.1 hypothetical protein L21TH_1706 [Caldisalinibacter kiritimatiensis]